MDQPIKKASEDARYAQQDAARSALENAARHAGNAARDVRRAVTSLRDVNDVPRRHNLEKLHDEVEGWAATLDRFAKDLDAAI